MTIEMKRDVFDAVVNSRWRFLAGNTKGEPTDGECMMAYEAALPDDLPVVSKDVSNTMRTYYFLWWKEFLDKAYNNELNDDEDINYKVRSESAEVARALILGMWRVEETGEIVKLEAEK